MGRIAVMGLLLASAPAIVVGVQVAFVVGRALEVVKSL